MPCHQFIELKIDDYLTGRLSPEDKSHFDDIIGQCADCRRFLEDQQAVYDRVHRVPSPEIPDSYWASLEKSILSRIDDRDTVAVDEVPTKDGKDYGIWTILVPLAASFLIFLASLSIGERPGTSPEATMAIAAEENAGQTNYARLIENQEIVAISYITTSLPGTFGF